MPATKIGIVNDALISFGHRPLSSLDESNDTVRKVNAVWDMLVDMILESCNWNFARNWAKLEKIRDVTDATDPFYGSWAHLYRQPNQSLKARVVFPQGQRYAPPAMLPKFIELQSENNPVIATDLDNAFVEYTKRILDESQFSANFCQTLSAGLAAKLALPVTMNTGIASKAAQLYAFQLSEARRLNSERDNDKKNQTGGYVDGRGGHRGGR